MTAEPDDLRQTRFAKNESLFRSVNERVKLLSDRFELESMTSFVCECASMACTSQIEMSRDEYEGVRMNSRHFAVRPGHEVADIERVVRDHVRFHVVEKTDVAAQVASAMDPSES